MEQEKPGQEVNNSDKPRILKHNDLDLRLYPGQTARLLSKPGLRYSSFAASTKEDEDFPEDAAEALGVTEALRDADRIEFDEVFLGKVGFESLVSNPHFSGVRELGE